MLARQVIFQRDPRKDDRTRWLVRFSMGPFGPVYCIPLTDPETTLRLNAGEEIASECLVTVSLTAPIEFRDYQKPPLCYKLAATVLELPEGKPS